jgi:hypothetical protein
MSMVSHGDQLIISMYWGGGMGKLFVSNDNGTTWLIIDSLPQEHSISAMASKNNVLFVGTGSNQSGVFYTTDLIDWIDFSNGLESYDFSVSQLVATDEFIYKTGGTFETYQISLSELSTQFKKEQSIQFRLFQNHPNPFNPFTILRYEIPEDSFVDVTIYDMLGKVVTNLVKANQSSGYKSIQWDATDNQGQPVSAGVYLYTIEAGEFMQTKKMILLK